MDRSRQSRGLTHPAPAPSAAGSGSPTLADTLQGLQRSAGNRAVGEILGLDSGGAPQNVPGSRAVIPGIGTIPLESVQFGRLKRPRGRGEEKPDGDEQPGGEMIFVSKQGPHSTALHKALLDGTAADVEVVIVSSRGAVLRMMLKGAFVSSYQPSTTGGGDPLESWSLDFDSMTQSIEGEAGV